MIAMFMSEDETVVPVEKTAAVVGTTALVEDGLKKIVPKPCAVEPAVTRTKSVFAGQSKACTVAAVRSSPSTVSGSTGAGGVSPRALAICRFRTSAGAAPLAGVFDGREGLREGPCRTDH